jgi:hypothetical protein
VSLSRRNAYVELSKRAQNKLSRRDGWLHRKNSGRREIAAK